MSLSPQTNKALHLWFRLIAEALTAGGYGVKRFMEEVKNEEIDFNEIMVKEQIWKAIQRPMTETESTRDLNHEELDAIIKQVDRILCSIQIDVEFPSQAKLMMEGLLDDQIKENQSVSKR